MAITKAGMGVLPQQVIDLHGEAQFGAVLSLFESDGTTLATRWADADRGAAAANPWHIDSLGNAAFLADPGSYVLSIDVGGTATEFATTVPVDPADAALASDVTAGDAANAAAVTAEAARAVAAEGSLSAAVTSEASTRAAADASEVTARAAAVTAEAAARSAADASEASTRASADTANANAITAEAARATTAEGAEATRAIAAEGANAAAIASEASTRAAAVAAETARATGVEAVKAAVGDGASAGAAATSALLKSWVTSEGYELTAITRDVDEVVVVATVKWPDGSGGTFTTVTKNATWLAIDAYTVSHTLSGKTVTQAAVTRDSAGAITAKPALTVA